MQEEKEKEISLPELDALVERKIDLAFKKDAHKVVEKAINKEIADIDNDINEILKASGRDKFSHPRGNISIQYKESVKLPDTPEKREKLFGWLKQEKLYDEYITINSQSLNSLYKKYKQDLLNTVDGTIFENEDDKKVALANALNFKIPGIDTPSTYEKVGLTGKKPKKTD